MEYGICMHSVIPLRAEPSHKSEMVNQVLFGELYEITERENSWCRITTTFDHYDGWIDSIQAHLIEEQEYTRLNLTETAITLDLVQLLSHENGGAMMPVVMGSSLPGFDDSGLRIGKERFIYEGQVSGQVMYHETHPLRKTTVNQHQLIEDAMLYLNAPYLWGGRTPFGIDCSGFVQMVFKIQGLKLLRDASQQATFGEVVSLIEEAEQGDLAFFDDPEGKIIHVGVLADHQRIIHCSGKVRIDALDHEGIYNHELQRYTHKLRLIKRIFGKD